LAAVRSLIPGDALTDRTESHPLYDVTEASGVTVTVWGDKAQKPAAWLFGKMAPDYVHIYVRDPRSATVYLAEGVQKNDLEKPLRQWRERRIFVNPKQENIDRVEYVNGPANYDLVRSSNQWTLNGKPVETQIVENLISTLRVFSADDFIDPPESLDLKKFGLDNSKDHLAVTWGSGETTTIFPGKKDPAQNRLSLRRNDEPVFFWIPADAWENFSSAFKSLSSPK
jgi:hypothetical protein